MKAVLVFCEGRHDVVFVQRSLGALSDCEWVDKRISELPSPFGIGKTTAKGLIARRIERHSLENPTLQEAAHSPLPCFESVVENNALGTMYFLVRVHGCDRQGAILDLLEDLRTTITEEAAGTYDVSEYAAAFLFDADTEGLTATLTKFRDRYTAFFEDLSSLEHSQWASEATVPVGCFVFHGGDQDETGTLEDHLAPMAEAAWPNQYAEARNFIDDNKTANDKVSTNNVKRLKAIITVTGQFNHPGDPMSIIIARSGLSADSFKTSQLSQALVGFLTEIPWKGSQSRNAAVVRR